MDIFDFKISIRRIMSESLIQEDAQNNLGQAGAILRGTNKSQEAKAKAKEEIQKLAELTTAKVLDKSPKEGGEHVDLPILAKWIVNCSILETIVQVYNEFI